MTETINIGYRTKNRWKDCASIIFYGPIKACKSMSNIVRGKKLGRSFFRVAGALAGAYGGVVAGGMVGTLLFPGLGTVIGMALGALIGSSSGAFLTKHVARYTSAVSTFFRMGNNETRVAYFSLINSPSGKEETLILTNPEKYLLSPSEKNVLKDKGYNILQIEDLLCFMLRHKNRISSSDKDGLLKKIKQGTLTEGVVIDLRETKKQGTDNRMSSSDLHLTLINGQPESGTDWREHVLNVGNFRPNEYKPALRLRL